MSKVILFVILILGIIFSVYLVSQKTSFFSKASPDKMPRNLTISNISDGGFTVSWVTDEPTIGILKYSEDSSFNLAAYDERDATGPKARLTHFVVLKGLKPQQTYYLKIEQNSFQQATGPTVENAPPAPVLVYGKIKKNDGDTAEAIIYLKLPDSTTLSTYSRDGNFLITASNARISDLSSYSNVKTGDLAEVWVDAGKFGNIPKKQIPISVTGKIEDLVLEEIIPLAEKSPQTLETLILQPFSEPTPQPTTQPTLATPTTEPINTPITEPSPTSNPTVAPTPIPENVLLPSSLPSQPLPQSQPSPSSPAQRFQPPNPRVSPSPKITQQIPEDFKEKQSNSQNWIQTLWKTIIEVLSI